MFCNLGSEKSIYFVGELSSTKREVEFIFSDQLLYNVIYFIIFIIFVYNISTHRHKIIMDFTLWTDLNDSIDREHHCRLVN